MSEKYDVVIIGAGIGGLVCGCYLAKAGLKVLIVEKNDKPGGYCTSFERDGYRFDVGVHYLGGIKRGVLGKILEELEIKNEIKFHQFDPTDKIITPYTTVYIRSNPYDTIKEFKKKFPKEKNNINKFFRFLMEENFLEIYKRTRRITFKVFLDEMFEEEEIKNVINVLLANIGLSAYEIAALSAVVFYREYILDPGYYPIGGMQTFSDILSKKFEKFGGRLMLSSKVKRIVIKNNKVCGVIVKKRRISSNIVVSNVDATQTFKHLLPIGSKESKIIDRLIPSPSIFAVYLGLKDDFKNIINEDCCVWYSSTRCFSRSFVYSPNKRIVPVIMVSFPSFHDKDCYSKRKAVMEIFTVVSHNTASFWEKYKFSLCDLLLKKVEREVIGKPIRKYIFIKEIATPKVFHEYTLSRKGAVFGWASTLDQINISLCPQKTSIEGLFLVGNWTTIGSGQGGVPKVAYTGRKGAKLILESMGRKWQYSSMYYEKR